MKTPIFILRNAWNMEVKIQKKCAGSFTFVQDDNVEKPRQLPGEVSFPPQQTH